MHPRPWDPPTPEEAAHLPALSDGCVVLRPWIPTDTDALFEAVHTSRVAIGRWLGWCHPGYARADAAAFIRTRPAAWAAGEDFAFAVLDATDGRLLGACGLHEINRLHRFGGVGYWVRTSETGRGIASRAARLVARFGVVHLGLERIEIVVAVGNEPSQRAALRTGARREGVLRHRLNLRGTPLDAVMFSLVPADFDL